MASRQTIITQKEVVQIWPYVPKQVQMLEAPSLILGLLQIASCASEQDPLDPQSTHMILYSASTRARSTRGKSPCTCNTRCLISLASSWRYASHLLPLQCGEHSMGSKLFLHPFPLIRAIWAASIFILERMAEQDLGAEFADGGVANQPVILQTSAGLSCCQVSQSNF